MMEEKCKLYLRGVRMASTIKMRMTHLKSFCIFMGLLILFSRCFAKSGIDCNQTAGEHGCAEDKRLAFSQGYRRPIQEL
jgi:hypothetical protein